MASRGVFWNGKRSRASPSDEEEPHEREDEEREMVIRIPTLRSTIVRIHPEEHTEEDGPVSPPPGALEVNQVAISHEQQHSNRKSRVRGGGCQAQLRERERESGWRQREGGGSHGQNHRPADISSRKDRDDSPSSADSRDTEAGSRYRSAEDRSHRAGRNVGDWRSGRQRGDARDEVRSDRRREADRGREGERGDSRDAPVPELHSIHKATVHSIRPFGVFVRMEGYRNHGLVHLSQISDHEVTNRNDSDASKIEAISSVVGEGEQVWVKVISVKDEDDGSVKVGCSLKYVSQGDGRDLDPNSLQLEKLQSKPAWQAPKKLELEAVYNVVCSRCGGHGHLKKECYSTGEKTYALLQDEESEDTGAGSSKVAAGVVVPKNLTPTVGLSSKPPSGPVGRGRAMVQPAWMKHGVGVGGVQEKVLLGHSSKTVTAPPEKVTTVQEALAVLGKVKEEKRRRRDERRHRKHSRRSREKKHGNKEGRREKHRNRHHRCVNDQYRKSRKKRRV